ncbi:MAG: LamB/YcsF family protein, partial [Vicinamibacterales bacterium]
MQLPPAEIEDSIRRQLEALAAVVADTHHGPLRHVKPHGALYNMAARESRIAAAVARAVRAFDASLLLIGLAGSALPVAAERVGLWSAGEGFVDRAYQADGTLVPRGEPGAVLRERATILDQALRLVSDGIVVATTGERVRVKVDSLCIHGDTPGAADLAADLRATLQGAGVEVRALTRS